MISELIGGVIDLYKQRLKKQQNITRREIKKEELRIEKEEKEKEKAKKEGRPVKPEKGLLGGRVRIDLNGVQIDSKKEQLRKETARRSPKKRSFVQKKMDARKCEAVKKSKRKELLLRTQIIVLTVIKYVVKIIEMFIKFLISVLGVLGFAIVLFVLVLMIVIYGILKIEYVAPSGDVLVTDSDDCIQGGNVLVDSGFDLSNTGQLLGTLTEHQKNLLYSVQVYNDILSGSFGNPTELFNEKYAAVLNGLGTADKVASLMGFMSIENGFNFPGSSNILTEPTTTQPDVNNDAWLGLEAEKKDFDGKYEGKQYYSDSFVQKFKAKYSYSNYSSLISCYNYAPYGMAIQIGFLSGKYTDWSSTHDYIDTQLPILAEKFGIKSNIETLKNLCHIFMLANGYHGHNSDMNEPELIYWVALWAATSDNDADRGFDKIELNSDSYSESTYRGEFLGYSSYAGTYGGNATTITNLTYVPDSTVKGYIKINGSAITTPVIKYVYDYCVSKGLGDLYQPVLDDLNGRAYASTLGRAVLNQNYNYGLMAYLAGRKVINDIGISAPLASGGNSIDDCECVETDSVFNLGNRDFSNITVGEPQGIYPASIREEVKKMTKYQPYFGKLDSLSDSDGTLSGNMSREEWRLWTKWKVPYQYQVGGDNWQDGIYRSSYEKNNACPLYLQAYMYSALTGTAMNVQELQAAQAVYYNGGVAGAEHDGGYYPHFKEFCEMAKDAGFYVRVTKYVNGSHSDVNVTDGAKSEAPIIYPDASLSIKEQIDYVLDNNGIVGVVVSSSSPFASSQHYFCITEHVSENEYKTHSATNQSLDVKTHKLEEIIGTNGAWLYTGHAQNIVFAWNPNLEVSRTLVGNGDGIAELSNILFVGDSYTVGLNNSKNLESENEIFAAVSASPSQFVGSTSQSVTIGAGDGNEKTGQIPDGNYNAVIVLLGVNNLSQTEGMKTFLEELDSKFDCPIYVQKVFPVGSGYSNGSTTATEMNENIKTYNDTIKSFCDSNNAFTFIDTTSGLVDADGFLSQTSDNLHLNGSSAFDIWYNNIKSSVLNGTGVSTGNQYDVDCIDENTVVGDFVETPGQFQGPWGDLTDYVNQMSSEKSTYQNLIQYVGLKPVNESESNYLYNVDAYKTKNGKGFVRYNQGYGNKRETWSGVSFGDSTFASAGCGVYSTAGVLSTMLGKYINPVEVAIAISTYEIRHPGSNLALSHMNGDNFGAFTYTDLAKVIEECGLSVETASSLSMTKVDDCLNNSGMVILVVNSSFNNRYTSGGHYVVIREKTSTGYLIYSSTNWVQGSNDDYCNTENTASELQTLNSSGQIVYVTP